MDENFRITEGLTLAEAVGVVGVSRQTLLRRIADGSLEAHRTGPSRNSQYLVTEAALAKCFPVRKKTRVGAA